MSDKNSTCVYLNKSRFLGYQELCKHIIPTYAIKIENSVYNYCKQYIKKRDIKQSFFKQIYNTTLSDVCSNLNQENVPSFVIKIINNEVLIDQIPYIKYTEINPERWSEIIKRREYAEFKRDNMGTTSAYVCKKCGGNKHTTYSLQTRSCDEPMTIFVTCQTCKFQFRQ